MKIVKYTTSTPLKNSAYMTEWMAQTYPLREASKVYKNEWPVATPLFK